MGELQIVMQSGVPAWECDLMGHLNLQFYVAKAEEATACASLMLLGKGPQALKAEGLRLALVDQHVRLHRELRSGAAYLFRAGIIDVGSDEITFYFEMAHRAAPLLAATFVNRVKLTDRATGKAQPLPDALRKAALAKRVDLPAHAQARGVKTKVRISPPTLAEANELKLLNTITSFIPPTHTSADGLAQPHYAIYAAMSSYLELMAQVKPIENFDLAKVGHASVEFFAVYGKIPREGDVLTLRGGLSALDRKTFNWCKWVFDAETGEYRAGVEVTQLLFDLEARRAMDMPEQLRASLAPLVRPGLTP